MNQPQNYISPAGIAIYPNIRKPEMYNEVSQGYTIKLELTPEAGKQFIDFLYNLANKEKASTPDLKDIPIESLKMPYKRLDNGNYQIKFKSKEQFQNSKGAIVQRKIKIYDANAEELPEEIDVGHGSTVIINYRPTLYKTPLISGMKLLINAVQVINLIVARSKTNDASYYGFQPIAHDPFQQQQY